MTGRFRGISHEDAHGRQGSSRVTDVRDGPQPSGTSTEGVHEPPREPGRERSDQWHEGSLLTGRGQGRRAYTLPDDRGAYEIRSIQSLEGSVWHSAYPAPATIEDEGLADARAADPFRLPRLHPGIGGENACQPARRLACARRGQSRDRRGTRERRRHKRTHSDARGGHNRPHAPLRELACCIVGRRKRRNSDV